LDYSKISLNNGYQLIFMCPLVAQQTIAAECTALLDVVLPIANQLINYDDLLCAGMAI
jgi:hypothetical protein